MKIQQDSDGYVAVFSPWQHQSIIRTAPAFKSANAYSCLLRWISPHVCIEPCTVRMKSSNFKPRRILERHSCKKSSYFDQQIDWSDEEFNLIYLPMHIQSLNTNGSKNSASFGVTKHEQLSLKSHPLTQEIRLFWGCFRVHAGDDGD